MSHVDHLSWGNQTTCYFFCLYIYNVAFIFYLSGQEAFLICWVIDENFTMIMPLGAKHKIEKKKIYLWSPM